MTAPVKSTQVVDNLCLHRVLVDIAHHLNKIGVALHQDALKTTAI